MPLSRHDIARRAAMEVPRGGYVNLGLGIPTLVSNYIPEEYDVTIHSENGVLGVGPFPYEGDEDPDLLNASKETVTLLQGGSYFDSAMSFSMVRGGHIDVTILGAMEVAGNGDLANWAIPGRMISGMGGAMDLVVGAQKVILTMEHVSKRGAPKIVKACTLPLTGKGVVDVIITDIAFITVEPEGLMLREIAPGVSKNEVMEKTEAPLQVASDLREMFVTA
ncbi:MAG: CoA transferase subunit B [Nitrospinae bacterium]|nr:CoA transferase subunit B [Nitrospinota bacterium]